MAQIQLEGAAQQVFAAQPDNQASTMTFGAHYCDRPLAQHSLLIYAFGLQREASLEEAHKVFQSGQFDGYEPFAVLTASAPGADVAAVWARVQAHVSQTYPAGQWALDGPAVLYGSTVGLENVLLIVLRRVFVQYQPVGSFDNSQKRGILNAPIGIGAFVAVAAVLGLLKGGLGGLVAGAISGLVLGSIMEGIHRIRR